MDWLILLKHGLVDHETVICLLFYQLIVYNLIFQLPTHNNRGSGYQKSMVATELVPIMLRRGSEIIWFNEMVNSPFGICQLRLSYEKETDGNISIQFLLLHWVIWWCTLCVWRVLFSRGLRGQIS